MPALSICISLATTALLSFSVAFAVVFAVPSGEGYDRLREYKGASRDMSAWFLPKLLALIFIVSAGVGAFEVGLALMFTECGLVMFLMQAIVFSLRFKPDITRWLIAPALFLVPQAADFTSMLVVIGAVSSSAGVHTPILTYWISAKAGSAGPGNSASRRQPRASVSPWARQRAERTTILLACRGACFILTAGVAVLGLLLSRANRIAQLVGKNVLTPKLESCFHDDSYGYRPHKSAHDALKMARRNESRR